MSNLPSDDRVGLLVSRDLFFTSKVTGTASALGFRVEVVSDTAAAIARIAEGGVRCMFCDLSDPALNVAGLLAARVAPNRPRTVAFGSHVATARLQEARDAGCDEVLPRSRFSAELPDLLRRCLTSDE